MKEIKPELGLNGKNLKAKYFKNFTLLRHGRIEETPMEIAGEMLNSERILLSKYHSNFFLDIVTGINNGILPLIQLGLITDPEVKKKCEEFVQFVEKLSKEKFEIGQQVNETDVAKANDFLDYILSQCQS